MFRYLPDGFLWMLLGGFIFTTMASLLSWISHSLTAASALCSLMLLVAFKKATFGRALFWGSAKTLEHLKLKKLYRLADNLENIYTG